MKVCINPEDVNSKLSIAYAMRQGYKVTLDADGCAEVVNGNGNVYHVHNFTCDCPDATQRDGGSYTLPDGRHLCKHTAWVSQVYPCECGGIAVLNTNCNWRHFLCPRCHTMTALVRVQNERRAARAEAEEIRKDVNEVIRKAEEASKAVFA